ncbi:hypothetical protein R5R35_003758 [Gryllus longicercus]|uniref:Dolichyl-diphosphooligosaccharide--protein glycosyltransferase subunit 1 n=1 Tax=Gryllus longicercus TaxID=2509291 RepID=A0AAN9YZN9_9ORTH
MKRLLILHIIAIIYLAIDGVFSENPGIKIRNVDRVIDLTTQLVKISEVCTLENSGNTPIKNFQYTLKDNSENLAFFSVQSGDSSKSPLRFSEKKVSGQSTWTVELNEPLASGKTTVVDIDTVFSHRLVPYPSSITQKEKQLVLFHGNHYFYSPYPVARQTSTVNLGSKAIESYSKLKPVSQSESTLNYGPYENIAPLSFEKMTIHFENNSPFLTVTNLLRVIEVSHWGNIAVEETVDLLHTGAVLKGPFSRYEYQRETHSGLSSVKSFKTLLPAAAKDAYYRDEIGNISTSHMKILSDSVELDLRPRFPLFGGWKTHYIIGYNVPSYEYLYNSGDDYLLRMRFIDHIFDDMIVEEVTTKIILPEGSHNVKLQTPYPVQRLGDTFHYTYLDTKGRLVITMHKTNLVENHIQDFKLHYKFPRMLMLQEPLLVIAAFYLLFLLVIVYVRLDFSITKDEAGENRMRVAGYCEKVLAHQDKRAGLYRHFDEQLVKLKSSKDVNAFQSSMKSFNQEYKTETSHIAELLNKLKTDAPDIAEKVQDLQKLDKQLRDLYQQHQTLYVDKLVPGKIARPAFVDTENQLNRKKEECTDKINAIVKSLQ